MAKSKKRTTKPTQDERMSEPARTRPQPVVENSSNNRSLLSRLLIAGLVLLGLYMVFGLFSNLGDQQTSDVAKEDDETSQVEDAAKPSDTDGKVDDTASSSTQLANGTTVSETNTAYTYVVGEGESFTTIARNAIARIGGDLTPAERVAAETKLATDANAELLNVGQSLTLVKSTVKAAIDYAKGLSADEKAAWQLYADHVVWQANGQEEALPTPAK